MSFCRLSLLSANMLLYVINVSPDLLFRPPMGYNRMSTGFVNQFFVQM